MNEGLLFYKQFLLTQFFLTMFSWIQQHILIELTKFPIRRYTQLRPKDVEGNVFSYHLQGLIKDKYIEKTEEGLYKLSAKGVQFASTLSLNTKQPRRQPKVETTVFCRNQQDEYLLIRWKRQPYAGLVAFPHGLVHFGESLEAMASIELAEKAGMRGNLQYRGHVSVRAFKDNEIEQHNLLYIFEAKHVDLGPQAHQRHDVCESFWASAESIPKDQWVPGFYQIIGSLKAEPSRLFFSEIILNN